jgi:hypothetical protein
MTDPGTIGTLVSTALAISILLEGIERRDRDILRHEICLWL